MEIKAKKSVNLQKLVERVPVALAIIPVLRLLAQRQETTTYKELGEIFGLHQKAIPGYLRVVDIYCTQHNLPRLNYLVVNQETQVAGGKMVPDAPMTFTEQLKNQEKIFGFKWKQTKFPSETTIYSDVIKTVAH